MQGGEAGEKTGREGQREAGRRRWRRGGGQGWTKAQGAVWWPRWPLLPSPPPCHLFGGAPSLRGVGRGSRWRARASCGRRGPCAPACGPAWAAGRAWHPPVPAHCAIPKGRGASGGTLQPSLRHLGGKAKELLVRVTRGFGKGALPFRLATRNLHKHSGTAQLGVGWGDVCELGLDGRIGSGWERGAMGRRVPVRIGERADKRRWW